jgi:hypothetical protein
LLTVTVTPAEVVELPAASLATAVRVCAPFAAFEVFHPHAYGPVVIGAP